MTKGSAFPDMRRFRNRVRGAALFCGMCANR